MWYIIDAAPGAKLIYGLAGKYTSEELSSAIQEGTLEKMMNYVPVHAGEAYFIPSGLVHAIGGGILIAEIQQNSNITYRVYDYNRRDDKGNLRPLHVKDALAVIESTDPENVKSEHDDDPSVIAKCKYFTVKKHELSSGDKELFAGEESFMHIMCVKGNAKFTAGGKEYALSPADTYFVPAGMGKITLLSSDAVVITTTM